MGFARLVACLVACASLSVACAGTQASAQDASDSFASAFARAVSIGCLSWTRDQLQIQEIHLEARLHRLPSEGGATDDLWRTDFPGGHLTLAQHNDGTFACSAKVVGGTAESVLTVFEQNLVEGGVPEGMRFQVVSVAEKNGLVDHLYRQSADAHISVLLTLDPQAAGETTVAMLTFFYERPSPHP